MSEYFSKDLQKFLRDLKANNTRAWMDAHKADYGRLLMEPAKDFVSAMGPALQAFAPNVRAEPRVNGTIMRMNRDTRFSKDKTPYKTALHFIFWEGAGKPREHPAFYLRFDDRHVGLGAGLYGFSDAQLAKFRKLVLDDAKAPGLMKVLVEAEKASGQSRNSPDLKRVPKGFDAGHIRAELLLYKSLSVGGDRPLPDALFDGDFVAYCAGEFQKLRPLHRWLVDNL